MTHRDEDEEIIDSALDTLAWQRREIDRLKGALKHIEAGTYPRPLGKPWRMDASSSKHDRCIHDAWMYETCDECLDAFVRATLDWRQ